MLFLPQVQSFYTYFLLVFIGENTCKIFALLKLGHFLFFVRGILTTEQARSLGRSLVHRSIFSYLSISGRLEHKMVNGAFKLGMSKIPKLGVRPKRIWPLYKLCWYILYSIRALNINWLILNHMPYHVISHVPAWHGLLDSNFDDRSWLQWVVISGRELIISLLTLVSYPHQFKYCKPQPNLCNFKSSE